jgi:hypothetical protein
VSVVNVNKANPTRSSTHINRPLANIAIAYQQKLEGFAAAKMFPSVPVDKQSDLYPVWDRGDMNRDEAMEIGPGGEAPLTGLRVSTDTYFAKVYALGSLIADQDRANEDSEFATEQKKTEALMRKAWIKRERLWVSTFFAPSTWTGSVSGSDVTPTNLWSDYTLGNPIADLRPQILNLTKACNCEPSDLALAIGPEAWAKLVDHPVLLERIEQTQKAVMTEDIVASLLGIGRVVVPHSTVNTAKEGAAASISFTHGKHALLAYAPMTAGRDDPAAGKTFVWTGLTGTRDGILTKKFRREVRGSDQIEVHVAFAHKVTSAISGVFFNGVVA